MEQFAPLMFLGLIVVMLIGFPVAFSLGALGLYCGFYAIEMGWFPVNFLNNLPLNIFGILSNELLLAIPFFTLMGSMLEKCGLAEDMLDSMGQLFGPVRGGLGYSVIIVGFILGAITGTVAASVIAMGLISLPVMMRYGYDMRLATGVIAASGTITQLIPPSLVLVVLADQLGKSVGDMYLGAVGPSFIQVGLFVAYVAALTDTMALATGIIIQNEVGGNLIELVSSLSNLLRERVKMRRKVRVLTSEGRMSGAMLSALPIFIFLALNLVSPKFYGEVWDKPIVTVFLVGGFIWMLLGNFVIYRMVNFKY